MWRCVFNSDVIVGNVMASKRGQTKVTVTVDHHLSILQWRPIVMASGGQTKVTVTVEHHLSILRWRPIVMASGGQTKVTVTVEHHLSILRWRLMGKRLVPISATEWWEGVIHGEWSFSLISDWLIEVRALMAMTRVSWKRKKGLF
jgi:peptidyl-tRNA hydrolase